MKINKRLHKSKTQHETPSTTNGHGSLLTEGLNNIITYLDRFVNLSEQKVYHGTNKQFKQFDPNFMNRMDYGYGFYFTINKSYAQSYGKYFLTCEIPEDNYLLHWDESYDYQPEHIQNCLDNLCSFFLKKDLDLYNKITDIVYGDLNTGYWIYMKISELLNLPGKELSELFYNFGIKGIYSFKGDCFVVFNKNDIKILKTDINEETFKMPINKNIMERFEEIESQIFATNSVYDVINILKNKPKSYRVVFDKKLNYYFIGDARNYIHLDLLEAAFRSGFYPELYSEAEMQDYMDDNLFNEDILLFAFYPTESHAQDIEKSSDGYTRKYVYDFGVIYAHEMTPLEDFDIYKTLSTPIKKQEIFEMINIKKLNEKLEEALGNTIYFGSDHFDPEVIFYSDQPFEMDNTAEINLDGGNLMFLTCNDEDILVTSLPYKSIEEIKKEIEDSFDDIKEEAEEYDYVELYDGVFDELGGFEFEADELPDNASEFADLILDGIENSYVDGDSSSASIIFDKDFNILLGKGLSLVKHEEDEEEE